MSIFSKLISSLGGGSLIKDVLDGADELFTSKEEKLEFQRLFEEAERKHTEKLIELATAAEQQHLADRQNARQMQIEALKQNDTFSKRFVYFLSLVILLAAIGFGVSLMFVPIPEENRRLIEMFADIFLFSGALTVIMFYFGSSRGSDEKNAILKNQNKQ